MGGWNSFKTNEPFGLTAELTTFAGGGGDDEIGVYIAHPTGGGKHPALLAIHHMPGWGA